MLCFRARCWSGAKWKAHDSGCTCSNPRIARGRKQAAWLISVLKDEFGSFSLYRQLNLLGLPWRTSHLCSGFTPLSLSLTHAGTRTHTSLNISRKVCAWPCGKRGCIAPPGTAARALGPKQPGSRGHQRHVSCLANSAQFWNYIPRVLSFPPPRPSQPVSLALK